jgi:hypothetical protein
MIRPVFTIIFQPWSFSTFRHDVKFLKRGSLALGPRANSLSISAGLSETCVLWSLLATI